MADGGLVAASLTGDHMTALRALRRRLATAIDECGSKRDLAALSRQYMLVMKAVDRRCAPIRINLSPAEVIAARRAARSGVKAVSRGVKR